MSWLSSILKPVTSAVTSIAQAVGLMPKQQTAPTPAAAPAAPSADNSYAAMDAAAQQQAASLARGRTSTMLTGAQGETEDQKLTSKILLGQ